jgi:hypothetical protein
MFSFSLLWKGIQISSRPFAGEQSECSAVYYCGKVCRYPADLLQVNKVNVQLFTVVERYSDIQQA